MTKPFQQSKQPGQQEIQPLLQLLNSGQLAQAEARAKALLASYPNVFILHNVLGIALDGQRKFEEAVISYRKALTLQPNMPDLHFNLGIALANLGRLEESAASYRKALAMQPRFFEALGNLGTVLQKQGKLEEAIASYRKALAINSDALGHFNLATALRDQGKLEEAVESYRKALGIHPNYADAHNNLGETLRDQGKMEEAITSYQQALALNPQHPDANYNMAEFLYLANRYDEAIPHFERSRLDDWQERSLYCLYKAEKFDAFKTRRDALIAVTSHTSPFLATLSTHYSLNFGVEDPYNFCKNAMDYVYQNSLAPLAADGSTLLQDLLRDVNNTEIAERKQGRLHFGTQSAGNLFKRSEASFRILADLIKKEFLSYRERFAGADCELIRSFPDELEFTSSWYVKMQQGGHLTSHIHEIGWISGAVYLAMPQNKTNPDEGRFEYGTHGDSYPQKHSNFPVSNVAPNVGDIVLFPSSLFHRTIPFSSNEERICIAFDLRPASISNRKTSAY
ncbi:MAG TPA: tetratricopeptide repeat protein [Methylotenera sp.]|nr:tetratricopeptide repeat protein [Methylotenera sp.]